MATPPTNIPPPASLQGTSLVDRVNLMMHVRRYLKIVARRWIIFTACVLVGTGFKAYQAYNTPDMFRAVSIISVAPRLRTFATQMEYQEALDGFYDENLNLIRGVVKERAMEKYRQRDPLGPASPIANAGAQRVASSFQIIVDGPNLLAAKTFLTNWAREFIAYKNEIKDNTVAREEARTADEITRYTQKLEEARSAKAAFLRNNNIGSPQETGMAAQKRYDEATDRLQQIQTALKLERQRTPKDIAEGATTVSRQNTAQETPKTNQETEADPLARFAGESKYSELKLRQRAEESELERLQKVLKPAHPYLKQINARIAQITEGLNHQLDLIKEKREAHIRSLESQEASYVVLKAELLKDVQAKRTIQYEFERLTKEEEQIEKHLDGLQKAMLAFDKSSIDQSQFSIIQEGIQQASPASPDRKKMILQGLFFGLVCGVGLVYFLHRLDDRLELAAEIEEALEEPVLGQVPQIDEKQLRGKPILITDLDQYSFFAEAIRGVRSAVMLGTQGSRKQVFLVSSAVPGDGKTTFTVNFASTLALAGHKVLLVDADLRRGTTHNFFKFERDHGLSEVLAGEEHWQDVLKETNIKSLNIINSGRLPANPGELLLSPIVKEFLTEAREAYDFVVIDCPPLTGIDDAFSLIGASDGLLFVVRAGQTSMRFAKAALAAARQRGSNILGVILNGITADNPYYYYNSYYHSYYNKAPVDGGAGKLSSATPGSRMARRKAPAPGSIAAEAETIASAVEDEITKAERYRQMKARKRAGEGAEKSGNGDHSAES